MLVKRSAHNRPAGAPPRARTTTCNLQTPLSARSSHVLHANEETEARSHCVTRPPGVLEVLLAPAGSTVRPCSEAEHVRVGGRGVSLALVSPHWLAGAFCISSSYASGKGGWSLNGQLPGDPVSSELGDGRARPASCLLKK